MEHLSVASTSTYPILLMYSIICTPHLHYGNKTIRTSHVKFTISDSDTVSVSKTYHVSLVPTWPGNEVNIMFFIKHFAQP